MEDETCDRKSTALENRISNIDEENDRYKELEHRLLKLLNRFRDSERVANEIEKVDSRYLIDWIQTSINEYTETNDRTSDILCELEEII